MAGSSVPWPAPLSSAPGRVAPTRCATRAGPESLDDQVGADPRYQTGAAVPYDLDSVATDGSALTRLTSNGASEPAPWRTDRSCTATTVICIPPPRRPHAEPDPAQRDHPRLPARQPCDQVRLRGGAVHRLRLREAPPTLDPAEHRRRRAARVLPLGGLIAITVSNATACSDPSTAR